jgi:hypothetical protein
MQYFEFCTLVGAKDVVDGLDKPGGGHGTAVPFHNRRDKAHLCAHCDAGHRILDAGH